MSIRSHRHRAALLPSPVGASLLPVLIIVVALAISATVFFVFTRRQMEQKKEAEIAIKQEQVREQEAKKAAETKAPPQAAKPTQPAAAPVTPPPSFGFARPLDVGKQMAQSLTAGDFAAAGKLAAAADTQQADSAAAVFKKLVTEMGLKPGAEDQVEIVGLVENRTRIAIPFTKPGMDAPLRLQIDVVRDEKMGWKIESMTLPKEMSAALASMPNSPTSGAATTAPATAMNKAGETAPVGGAPTAPASAPATSSGKPSLFKVAESEDALSFAANFVSKLLKHDFAAARKFLDEKKVSAERLAGLCIVFEEGEYELKPAKPLIMTITNPEVSWVIAQVQSQKLQQSTEFGVEMQRSGADQPWQVVGLNLSDILGSFAASASKMGVPYTPIVQNPKGGEALALYFEYDSADLHPRAQKQLEIVAGILKSDENRKLNISGHTDAMGTDDYNIRLSQGRAEAVKEQLVKLGVPFQQVITSGLGKAQPLGPNQKADGTDNPEGRSKNRRAEILLDF